MPAPAVAFAAVSAGMSVMEGLFSYMASGDRAAVQESRGRMMRLEAEVEAQRYREEAESYQSSQSVQYTKSGVLLEGSPLTILDETMRVAEENISSIRAGGRARQFQANMRARQARQAGRDALLGGVVKGGLNLWKAGYTSSKNKPGAKD